MQSAVVLNFLSFLNESVNFLKMEKNRIGMNGGNQPFDHRKQPRCFLIFMLLLISSYYYYDSGLTVDCLFGSELLYWILFHISLSLNDFVLELYTTSYLLY
jgi:hypothetical protein